MKIDYFLTAVFALLSCASSVSAQNYTVSQTGIFSPQDAKDTMEGILKWWLPVGGGKGKERVQKALDFLTSNGWLTKRETIPPKRLYGINKERLSEIRDFLRARQAEKT
jgi:hypothetical protein